MAGGTQDAWGCTGMSRGVKWTVRALSGLGVVLMVLSLVVIPLLDLNREEYRDRMIVVGLWSIGAGVLATGFTLWAQAKENLERKRRDMAMSDMTELALIILGEIGDWKAGDQKTCPDCGFGGAWKTEVMHHSQSCWIEWHLSMGRDYWDADGTILDLLWPEETKKEEGV